MALPPENLTAEQLWAEIMAAPRPHRLVPFPRKKPDGTPISDVAMVVLTQAEIIAGMAAADREVRKLLKDDAAAANAKRAASNQPVPPTTTQGAKELYQHILTIECLWRACKLPHDINKPFFAVREHISKLTSDEIGILQNQYLETQVELSPAVSAMSEDEVDAWIEKLMEGGAAVDLLPFCSWGVVKTLVLRLVSRLANSAQDSASRGSQPSDSSENNESETTEETPSVYATE